MKKITFLLFLLLVPVVVNYAKNNPTIIEFVCPVPTDIVISSINNTGATFSWSSGSGETAWQILILPDGSSNPTASTTGTPVADTPTYSASTLNSGMHYRVYVRANCGTKFSAWTTALTFTTTCDPISVFNENFESTAVNLLPTCWSKILAGSTLNASAFVRTVSSNTYAGTRAIQMNNYNSGSDSNIILVSPNLGTLATGTHRIKFYAKSNTAAGSIELGTLNGNTNQADFTYFETISVTNSYAEYEVDFTTYVGTDTYIGIRHSSNVNTSLYLDNIRWELAPLCADVTNLFVNGTSPDSVTLSWTANDNETQWDITYGDATATDPSALTPISPAPTTNNGATISGLTANTTYKFWVRSVCGTNAAGYWIGPLTVTTACLSTNSFSENFDTTAVGSFPNCWSSILAGNSLSASAVVGVYNGSAVSGTNCIRMNNTNSGDDAKIMLVSPNLGNLSAATHRLKFYARGNGGGTTILDVGTLNNNTNNAVFNSYFPIELSEQYVEYIIDFGDYSGADSYIALKNASVDDYKLIFIDDIKWEAIPLCADVTNINVTDTTTSLATVNWLAGNSETNWQVAYGVNTITDPALATVSAVLTDTNLGLEELMAGTTYNVWVRSVCPTENGNWMGPIMFNTECNPMVSFNENFDSVSFPNLSVCWGKIITGASSYSDISVSPYSFTTAPNSVQLYGEYSGSTANVILVSPPVTTLSSGNYQLKFQGTGSVQLEIGTLNGNTNEATFTAFNTVTLSEFNTQLFTVDFASYSGTDTYIGFRLKTNGENAYASLDDVVWEPSLSSGAFDKAQFSYYPNPVRDVLNIAYDENITNVAVFNLLGQKVMENKADSNSVKMDMSALAAGNYIVKITANDQIKSMKVVKD